MKSQAIKHTKDVLIKYLRGYLANYSNYSKSCELDFSPTLVYDKDPNDLRELPVVVITGGSGQLVTGGLGDFAQEIYDIGADVLVSERYGGMYDFSFTIEIGTKTTKERELLTDLLMVAYRVQLRRFMQREGVLVKDMRYSGESEIPYGSDKIYISTIQISTWSEWYQDVDLLTVEDLKLN